MILDAHMLKNKFKNSRDKYIEFIWDTFQLLYSSQQRKISYKQVRGMTRKMLHTENKYLFDNSVFDKFIFDNTRQLNIFDALFSMGVHGEICRDKERTHSKPTLKIREKWVAYTQFKSYTPLTTIFNPNTSWIAKRNFLEIALLSLYVDTYKHKINNININIIPNTYSEKSVQHILHKITSIRWENSQQFVVKIDAAFRAIYLFHYLVITLNNKHKMNMKHELNKYSNCIKHELNVIQHKIYGQFSNQFINDKIVMLKYKLTI